MKGLWLDAFQEQKRVNEKIVMHYLKKQQQKKHFQDVCDW